MERVEIMKRNFEVKNAKGNKSVHITTIGDILYAK